MGKVLGTGIVFAVFGLLFAGIGFWLYSQDQELAETGLRANGTVIELDRYTDGDGDTMYRPLIEFRDADGTIQQVQSKVSSSSPSFARGEQVSVIYDPGDPSGAIIDTFMQRFFLPLIFGGMGVFFAVIGIGLVIYRTIGGNSVGFSRKIRFNTSHSAEPGEQRNYWTPRDKG
ncbi:MAG: DUF3592 domain-containing protein [Pseudomonadota bacterium]